MYRPPTYIGDRGFPSTNYFLSGLTPENLPPLNEGIYRMAQGAETVAKRLNLPLFRCKAYKTSESDLLLTVYWTYRGGEAHRNA